MFSLQSASPQRADNVSLCTAIVSSGSWCPVKSRLQTLTSCSRGSLHHIATPPVKPCNSVMGMHSQLNQIMPSRIRLLSSSWASAKSTSTVLYSQISMCAVILTSCPSLERPAHQSQGPLAVCPLECTAGCHRACHHEVPHPAGLFHWLWPTNCHHCPNQSLQHSDDSAVRRISSHQLIVCQCKLASYCISKPCSLSRIAAMLSAIWAHLLNF